MINIEFILEKDKNNSNLVKLITNSTDKIKLEAIKNSSFNLQYIEKPTDEMKFIALRKNGEIIRFIKNPTKNISKKELLEIINIEFKDFFKENNKNKKILYLLKNF